MWAYSGWQDRESKPCEKGGPLQQGMGCLSYTVGVRSAEVMLGSFRRFSLHQKDPLRLDDMRPASLAVPLAMAIREVDASAAATDEKCERPAGHASQDRPVVE